MVDSRDAAEPLDPFSLKGEATNFKGRGNEETGNFSLSKGILILGFKPVLVSGPALLSVEIVDNEAWFVEVDWSRAFSGSPHAPYIGIFLVNLLLDNS